MRAEAWHGAAFDPRQRDVGGVLTLENGRLSFAVDGDLAFDVPVSEVAKVDFSYGDSVMGCEVAGTHYRFFFSPPPGVPTGTDESTPADAEGSGVVSGTGAILESREVAKRFRAALVGHVPPAASPASDPGSAPPATG